MLYCCDGTFYPCLVVKVGLTFHGPSFVKKYGFWGTHFFLDQKIDPICKIIIMFVHFWDAEGKGLTFITFQSMFTLACNSDVIFWPFDIIKAWLDKENYQSPAHALKLVQVKFEVALLHFPLAQVIHELLFSPLVQSPEHWIDNYKQKQIYIKVANGSNVYYQN